MSQSSEFIIFVVINTYLNPEIYENGSSSETGDCKWYKWIVQL